MLQKKHFCGFTLVELIIVIVIVAILASLGYASYEQYLLRARRADVTADLLTISQGMERYFTEVGNYVGAALPFTNSPEGSSNVRYTIAFGANTTTAYTITATPVGTQARDTGCGTLTLNHAGQRCINGGTKCSDSAVAVEREAVAGCW